MMPDPCDDCGGSGTDCHIDFEGERMILVSLKAQPANAAGARAGAWTGHTNRPW
jgi:hypothetical protein